MVEEGIETLVGEKNEFKYQDYEFGISWKTWTTGILMQGSK